MPSARLFHVERPSCDVELPQPRRVARAAPGQGPGIEGATAGRQPLREASKPPEGNDLRLPPGDLFHVEHSVLDSPGEAALRESHDAKPVSRGTLEQLEGVARAIPDAPPRSSATRAQHSAPSSSAKGSKGLLRTLPGRLVRRGVFHVKRARLSCGEGAWEAPEKGRNPLCRETCPTPGSKVFHVEHSWNNRRARCALLRRDPSPEQFPLKVRESNKRSRPSAETGPRSASVQAARPPLLLHARFVPRPRAPC